jgi:hypothetical protein
MPDLKEIKNTLIFLELNEINFDLVQEYINDDPLLFPSLQRLMNYFHIRTSSESNYEEIEPWIQWVSVHTGLSFDQHKIFRLGDIVGSKFTQFYEMIEDNGVLVGCISPMNAENRLSSPAYFIPDPWTATVSDSSFWSKSLHEAISQAVNDNAKSQISFKSKILLLLGLVRFARFRNYFLYFYLVFFSRVSSWNKALFLDLFLHDLHLKLLTLHKPGFSSLFLNAGAHIQHHYFHSSNPVKKKTNIHNPVWYVSTGKDPVFDMLKMYDRLIGDYLNLTNVELIVSTGLSQQPYDNLTYYYRLRDHSNFLNFLNVNFKSVSPRMTRDFLIEFNSSEEMRESCFVLQSLCIKSDGISLFGEIEQRDNTAFVTLTYPNEITDRTVINYKNKDFYILPHLAFVALKNGKHQSEGFAFFSRGVSSYAPSDKSHVKEIFSSVLSYFGINKASNN